MNHTTNLQNPHGTLKPTPYYFIPPSINTNSDRKRNDARPFPKCPQCWTSPFTIAKGVILFHDFIRHSHEQNYDTTAAVDLDYQSFYSSSTAPKKRIVTSAPVLTRTFQFKTKYKHKLVCTSVCYRYQVTFQGTKGKKPGLPQFDRVLISPLLSSVGCVHYIYCLHYYTPSRLKCVNFY